MIGAPAVDLPACIDAGMDVEMPDSKGNHMPELEKAVKSGKLPIEKLDQAVERIEKLMAEYGKNRITENQKKEVSKDTRRKNHVLAGWIEAESAVLLKNESFFPLQTGMGLSNYRRSGRISQISGRWKQPHPYRDDRICEETI